MYLDAKIVEAFRLNFDLRSDAGSMLALVAFRPKLSGPAHAQCHLPGAVSYRLFGMFCAGWVELGCAAAEWRQFVGKKCRSVSRQELPNCWT
jgi:hypothetical protein